jgi:putative transposase
MEPSSSDHDRSVRKHPAHGVLFLDGKPTVIFDTICTKGRQPWLANPQVHDLLRRIWQAADGWRVGRYVVMPDHIHLFSAATDSPISYQNWVKYWKSQFTKQHGVAEHRWQTDNWDTRMRTIEHYEEKWEYVLENPLRKKLVTRMEDWPFQGVVFDWTWE